MVYGVPGSRYQQTSDFGFCLYGASKNISGIFQAKSYPTLFIRVYTKVDLTLLRSIVFTFVYDVNNVSYIAYNYMIGKPISVK